MNLQFKGKYVRPILSGEKRATIRTKVPSVDLTGRLHLFNGYRPHAKFATVGSFSMVRKRYSQLTEKDATDDGFRSLKKLKEALRSSYSVYGAMPMVIFRWRTVDPCLDFLPTKSMTETNGRTNQ